jgi:KGK domain
MNQTKQIIPDSQSVARCLDSEALEILGLHSTFTIEELLGKIHQSENLLEAFLSIERANLFLHQIRNVSSYGPPDFHKDINNVISSSGESLSKGKSDIIFGRIRNNMVYDASDFLKDIGDTALHEKYKQPSITNIFASGTNVLLLALDGKGWQKGKLKMCFEFIPEEDAPNPVPSQTNLVESTQSPLDEIRKLTVE